MKRSIRNKVEFVGGGGLLSRATNRAIDKLPFEVHLPGGYNYCGPGTKLRERLARGDRGINALDEACKIHDIAYALHKDSENRRQADKELAERAWSRVKSSDATFGERAAAWAVTTAMKLKSKIGSGVKRRPRRQGGSRRKGGKGLTIRKKRTRRGRVSKKKKGGVLPLLPVFAGLSALGSLAGGASAVAKVITDNRNAKKKLDELKRHNLAIEGRGLYLRPYKGRGKRIRRRCPSKKKKR